MQRHQLAMRIAAIFAAISTTAVAGIPEPDCVLYGTITTEGGPVMAGDDVTVVARVSIAGTPEVVGIYHMCAPCADPNAGPGGDDANAGDHYVLRIRVESLADGASQSTNSALIGQTATIYLRDAAGVETEVATWTISTPGKIEQLDLTTVPSQLGNMNCDGGVDEADVHGFVLALIDPALYEATYAMCDINRADMNADSFIDGRDISLFVGVVLGL